MDLHLTDEQAELLLAALDRLIENDRYPLSARVKALRSPGYSLDHASSPALPPALMEPEAICRQ